MLALVVCLACVAPNTEAIQVNPRRAVPIRKQVRRKKTYRLPAPLSAKVTYGPLTDQELGGQMTGGLTYPDQGTIRLPERDPYGLAHELFHVLDAQVLTDADRARFQKILRLNAGPWNSGTGTKGYVSPDEIAADYFAALATNLDIRKAGSGAYVSEYGPKRLRRFGNSLERLLKRRGLDVLDLSDYE